MGLKSFLNKGRNVFKNATKNVAENATENVTKNAIKNLRTTETIPHGISKEYATRLKQTPYGIKSFGFNSLDELEAEKIRQIGLNRTQTQKIMERLDRRNRKIGDINEFSSAFKAVSNEDLSKYQLRNGVARQRSAEEIRKMELEKAKLIPNKGAAEAGKKHRDMREIKSGIARRRDIESTSKYNSTVNDLRNKITSENSSFSRKNLTDAEYKSYLTDAKESLEKKEAIRTNKKDPNSKIYKAASIGVGGGMVLSMFNNRGQQSNAQLYNQQRAY